MSFIEFGQFLGGVNERRQQREENRQNERRLDIAEGDLELERRRELADRTNASISTLTERAMSIVSTSPTPRDDPRVQAALEPIRAAIRDTIGAAEEAFPGQFSLNRQMTMFEAAIAGTPTAIESATTGAAASVAGAEATAGGLGVSTRDAAAGAGLIPTPPSTEQLQGSRDRALAEGRTADAAQLEAEIEKRGTVTGRTEFDVGSAISDPTENRIEELRTGINAAQGRIEEIASAIAAVENAGAGSVGILGGVLETGTGLLQQLGPLGQDAAGALETATGTDLEAITAARLELRLSVANALETITGETSGRFTDTERRITEETLRNLTASASFEQVITAYQTFLSIVRRRQVRDARELLVSSGGTLETDEGMEAFGEVLRAQNVPEDDIVNIIVELLR